MSLGYILRFTSHRKGKAATTSSSLGRDGRFPGTGLGSSQKGDFFGLEQLEWLKQVVTLFISLHTSLSGSKIHPLEKMV